MEIVKFLIFWLVITVGMIAVEKINIRIAKKKLFKGIDESDLTLKEGEDVKAIIDKHL